MPASALSWAPVFPATRMRRLRRSGLVRALVRETQLAPGDLIQPVFVVEGETPARPSAPCRASSASRSTGWWRRPGASSSWASPAVLLFGVPERKDPLGSGAWAAEGVVQHACAHQDAVPELLVIADVCLCEYTDHGHCGMLDGGA